MRFQIQDDILDVEGEEAVFGKPLFSDEKNDKQTYVTMYGLEKAKKEVEKLSERSYLYSEGLFGGQCLFGGAYKISDSSEKIILMG